MVSVILLAVLASVVAKTNGEENKYRPAYACEGRQLRINCEPGHMIHLLRANYGRFSISICNEHGNLDWSVDCTSFTSFHVIKDACGLKNNCSLSASPTLFGDPCPGTPKYLEAHYQCVPEKSAVTPSTSTTTRTSSSTSTSRPSIIIPVTRNARPHPVAPPSAPPSPSTTAAPVTLRDATSEVAAATTTTTPSPLIVDSTTTLANSLLMVLGGTPETSTSEPSTVHLSRWSPDNHDDDPHSTLSCFPTESRGLFWNWTRAGHVALHGCPGGGIGRVRWRCDAITVQWVPETPDFSDCSSQWVESMKQRMGRGDPITSLAAELAVITRTKPLLAGDIVHSADILHRLVAEMGERTRVMDDPIQRQRLLLALLESVLAVSSNLLEDSHRLPWHDLNREQQQKSASALLKSQERSGWLLAESHHSRYSLRSGQPHVLAAVHVVESWDIADVVLPPPLDNTWWRVDDRLLVPAPALLATAKQGVSRLVLLVHHRLGDLLGSEVQSETTPTNASRIINSRVIGALLEGHRVSSLPRPITVTFKHLQVENVSNPLCVYWDYQIRSWSTEGCWLKYTNRSHTECQCSHLTNLAVIMHVSETQEQLIPTDHETLRMIIYIGCAITMIFLLLTLLVLQFIRCLRTERVTIHKHLCLCLLLAEAALVGGLEQAEEPKACSVLAGLLHYLLLAAFAWAFLDSFHLYILLGETDAHPDRWRVKWYSCVAYGVPLIVVAVSALIDPASYGTEKYCWLRVDNYYVFSFGGPAIACALASILFLCMTVGRICAQRNSTVPIKSKDQTKLSAINVWSGEATVLLLVLCSTWTLLPLFLHDEKVLTAYFFQGLNVLQGLLVFFFYCLNAGKVQSSDEPPGPDWLCSCLREPPRRRSLYSPPGSCPHNVSNPLSNPHINNPTQTLYPDRHFGSRSCEEHPLQYLLRTSDAQQRTWGAAPDPLCYYHPPHQLKQLQQQQQPEPHYETLEPLEGPPRPLLSSLAAVLNAHRPVAYCGIQSPSDSDRSSSSFVVDQPRLSSPELADSMPNLDRGRTAALPASLTY